ncbi:MAG TPA: phage tail tape measure protein, partial [Bacteroidales bacterium]|nr:phage tail tape measure protein [Bacteroidales bacterium]
MKKKVQQISLEGKFDVKDILKSLDLIKNALKGQDIKDGFAQKFRREMERVERSAETIEKGISKGFKSSEDTARFNAEIKSLVNNFNNLTESIKRTKVNLEDIEVSDIGKRAGLDGLTRQIEEANKEIDKLRNKDVLKSRIIDTGGIKLNVSKSMASELARSLFDPTVYAVKLKEMIKTIPVSKEFSDLGQRLNIDIDTPEGLLKAKQEFEKIKKLTEEIAQIQNSGMAGWKNKAGKLIQQYERENTGALPSNILSGGDLTTRVGNLQSFVGSFTNMEGQLEAFQRIVNLPNTITEEIQQQEVAINNNRQAFQDMADTMTGATHSQIVSSVDIATGSFDSLTRELNSQTKAADEHIKKTERMNAVFNDLGNRLKTFASVFTLWTFGRKQIEETWETIKKLDEGFASIAMVTSRSLESMWQQYSEYAEMSKKYGASTLSVIESSALFYQQGLDTNEVMEVTAETMKLATLSGLGFQQTTDLMTGAIRGFKLEMAEAGRVTDVYSELAAKAAADVREISYAMSKTASIAKESGMEFETTSAFLTQMIETTRESPENLGSAMKAVIARFQEVSKDPSITV